MWTRGAGGSKVLTGQITHGQQIPLPEGYSQSQCTWSVSASENNPAAKPMYSYFMNYPARFMGAIAKSDSNRIVSCGWIDSGSLQLHYDQFAAICSYIVACD